MRPTGSIQRRRDRARAAGVAALVAGVAAAATAPQPARAQFPTVPTPGLGGEFGTPGVPAPSALGGGGPGGPPVRLGPFFDEGLDGLLPSRRGDTAPAFDWFGSVQARALFTDNFRSGSRGGGREAEFVGSLRPTFGVRADTARLTGRVFYSPTFSVFAGESNEPARLNHRFGGNLTAVVVPESVFLNARAFGSLVPVLPGQQLEGDETPLPRRDFTQATTFILSPYAVHRFGTAATGIAGYTIARSERGGRAVSLVPGGPPVFVPTVLTTQTAYGALRTGEDFGRFAAELRGRGSVFDGGGAVTRNGHRAIALVETRYSFTRTVAGLVEGGYESLKFGGTRPVDINEPVWGVGVRLDPGPNSFVILRYRRRDGFDAPRLDSRVSLGPRTTAFASYFERLGTGLLSQSDLLTTVEVDELGNTVDSRTGEPSAGFGGAGGGFLGATGTTSLNRTRRGNIGVTRIEGLNSFTLRYTYDRINPVSEAPGTLGLRREAHTGTFAWSRPLSERTSVVGVAQIGHFEVQTTGSRGMSYLGRIGLRHLFSDTLFGSVQYSLGYRTNETDVGGVALGARSSLRNTVFATLTQAF